MSTIAKKAGVYGMIGGQTVDQNYCYTDHCTDHVVEDITVPDYEPVPDTKYHKGDTVKVINAIQYDNASHSELTMMSTVSYQLVAEELLSVLTA